LIFAASISCTAAGGVFTINSNDLSLKTEIATGRTLPGLSCVLELIAYKIPLCLHQQLPMQGQPAVMD